MGFDRFKNYTEKFECNVIVVHLVNNTESVEDIRMRLQKETSKTYFLCDHLVSNCTVITWSCQNLKEDLYSEVFLELIIEMFTPSNTTDLDRDIRLDTLKMNVARGKGEERSRQDQEKPYVLWGYYVIGGVCFLLLIVVILGFK